MRLFLVRHGQTDFNFLRKSQVASNPPINATGIHECQKCSQFLDTRLEGQKLDAVYSSTLLRTVQTTQVLLQNRPEPIVYEESTSLAEGCHIKSLQDYIKDIFTRARELGFDTILIVSHSSVIKYLVQWLAQKGQLKVPSHISLRTPKNASLSEIVVTNDGQASLILYNALATELS